MKQLYAMGTLNLETEANRDLTSTPAPMKRLNVPTLRSSSNGVQHHELQSALPAANYARPRFAEADSVLPVRLALLNTPAGRILSHVTPNHESYFAHTLLNVPETADAQLAIQTWGSPLWQRQDPNATVELPELPYLPVADLLDDASMKAWLTTPYRREMLEFSLSALLSTTNDSQIFLAASADDIAKVVYAITRALPSSLLDSFTFSTYESDPLTCSARLVGHESGSADADLPEACYKGLGVALNSSTGKRSDLAKEVPFAVFATAALAAGDFSALDEIKSTWERLGLTHSRHLDLVYRLSRKTGTLNKDEATEALQHPALTTWVSADDASIQEFLQWALEDRAFANTCFSRAVQSLRQKTDTLAKLAQTVRAEGMQALKSGDKNRTANALEVILPMVAPTKANAVWGELLAGIADPSALPWEMRWYLLPRFVRFKLQQNPTGDVETVFIKWLEVPAEHLGELLALDLPRSYQLAACKACLKQPGEPSAVLARTLAQHSSLALTLLEAKEGTASHDLAVQLFDTLLAETPEHAWLENVLARANDYSPDLLNRFFESTLAAGKVDADRVVRTQGQRVLELFAGRSGLDKLGKQFLAEPAADLLHNQNVLAFLGQLREQANLSEELVVRIDAVLITRAYLNAPTFDVEAMQAVAAALKHSNAALPTSARGELFVAVATAIKKHAHSATVQADLETALMQFGSTLAADSTDLYENLLRDLRSRTDLAKLPKLVEAFLAVALGATQAEELRGQLDGLDGHAFAVASDAAKRGGNRLLNQIDSASKDWPKEARTKWGFLLAAVKPKGLMRALRDVACVLVGAAVASLAWWIAN